MWDVIIQNFPLVLLILLACFLCGAEVIKALKIWREERDRRQNVANEEQQRETDQQNVLQQILDTLTSIGTSLQNLEARMDTAEDRLNSLTESDMHDIKAWIVVQYHKFYVEQGWIDNYSAETIERRYGDYIREGGNSYIAVLIERLRTLPMDPPTGNSNQQPPQV